MNRKKYAQHKKNLYLAHVNLKNKEILAKKKQWGLGLIVTNLMIVVIFGPWSWTLMDRRLS